MSRIPTTPDEIVASSGQSVGRFRLTRRYSLRAVSSQHLRSPRLGDSHRSGVTDAMSQVKQKRGGAFAPPLCSY